MRYPDFLCPLAIAVLIASVHAQTPRPSASVNQAAAFYHQGRFDTALVRLESLKSQGPWKHRDSLSLFQYLGMASARLGHDTEAVAYFSGLLELDSLFQFPRNEDPQVLKAFSRAQEQKASQAGAAQLRPDPAPLGPPMQPAAVSPGEPHSPPDNASGRTDSANAAKVTGKISMADSGAPGIKPSVSPESGRIGLALGAVPLGGGWLAGHKVKQGLAFGLLEAGGIVLSMYASQMQSREADDDYRVRNEDEKATIQNWKWVQRVSLSTALGAYLFSLIASAGD